MSQSSHSAKLQEDHQNLPPNLSSSTPLPPPLPPPERQRTWSSAPGAADTPPQPAAIPRSRSAQLPPIAPARSASSGGGSAGESAAPMTSGFEFTPSHFGVFHLGNETIWTPHLALPPPPPRPPLQPPPVLAPAATPKPPQQPPQQQQHSPRRYPSSYAPMRSNWNPPSGQPVATTAPPLISLGPPRALSVPAPTAFPPAPSGEGPDDEVLLDAAARRHHASYRRMGTWGESFTGATTAALSESEVEAHSSWRRTDKSTIQIRPRQPLSALSGNPPPPRPPPVQYQAKTPMDHDENTPPRQLEQQSAQAKQSRASSSSTMLPPASPERAATDAAGTTTPKREPFQAPTPESLFAFSSAETSPQGNSVPGSYGTSPYTSPVVTNNKGPSAHRMQAAINLVQMRLADLKRNYNDGYGVVPITNSFTVPVAGQEPLQMTYQANMQPKPPPDFSTVVANSMTSPVTTKFTKGATKASPPRTPALPESPNEPVVLFVVVFDGGRKGLFQGPSKSETGDSMASLMGKQVILTADDGVDMGKLQFFEPLGALVPNIPEVPFMRVLREATPVEIDSLAQKRDEEMLIFKAALELHALRPALAPMSIKRCEFQHDRNKLVIFAEMRHWVMFNDFVKAVRAKCEEMFGYHARIFIQRKFMEGATGSASYSRKSFESSS